MYVRSQHRNTVCHDVSVLCVRNRWEKAKESVEKQYDTQWKSLVAIDLQGFIRAQDWIRTSTPFRALPPQSSASTNFATWASVEGMQMYNIGSKKINALTNRQSLHFEPYGQFLTLYLKFYLASSFSPLPGFCPKAFSWKKASGFVIYFNFLLVFKLVSDSFTYSSFIVIRYHSR
jgi:hypothetical protein